MSKTVNVKSKNQSGGVTAGEVHGDVGVEQITRDAGSSGGLPVWLKWTVALVSVAAGVAALAAIFGD